MNFERFKIVAQRRQNHFCKIVLFTSVCLAIPSNVPAQEETARRGQTSQGSGNADDKSEISRSMPMLRADQGNESTTSRSKYAPSGSVFDAIDTTREMARNHVDDQPKTGLPSERETENQSNTKEINAIYDNIEALKDALKLEQRMRQKANLQKATQMPAKQPTDKTNVAEDPQPMPIVANPVTTNQQPESNTDETPDEPTGIRVIPEPVNSLELANSLMATKNYAQAIKSYESLMNKDQPIDELNWMRLLAATCYRMNGDKMKAESLYREVVSSKEISDITEHSKWFLEHMIRRQRIEEHLNAIDAGLSDDSEGGQQ